MFKAERIGEFLRKRNCFGTYIVEIQYKYVHEVYYRFTQEVIQYDGSRDCYEWLNDWNEGEEDCWVRGIIDVDDVDCSEGMVVLDE